MTNARELIHQLNSVDEHSRLEGKRGSEPGKSIMETVCAFSNEPDLGGGILLLGVERDEDSLFPLYRTIGVPDPDSLQRDLVSQCRSMFNVPIAIIPEVEDVDGKRVVVVHVPEAAPASKPIYFKATGLPQGAFRRVGSCDVRCKDEDLAVLYHGRKAETYDSTTLLGTSLDDIDPDALSPEFSRARLRVG